jgi:hypothetical protein
LGADALLSPFQRSPNACVLIALTFALVAAPQRAFEQIVQLERAGTVLPRPMLHAAAVATLPVSAVACSAALAASPTVGSVVIATLGAVLAYVGGVVAGDRVAHALGDLTAQAPRLSAAMALPTQALGLVAAFLPSAGGVPAALLGVLWSYRVGIIGSSDLLVPRQSAGPRAVAVCALAVNGPAVLRGVLYAL